MPVLLCCPDPLDRFAASRARSNQARPQTLDLLPALFAFSALAAHQPTGTR